MIPSFPLLLIIAAYLPNSGVAVLIAILVITGYSYGARQLRAQALSLRGRDYLEAARVRGERTFYVIAVEIIPEHDAADRRRVPGHRGVQRAVLGRTAVHRLRQPELGELGNDAVLGAE